MIGQISAQTSFEPASNQLWTSSESASVMEFGFKRMSPSIQAYIIAIKKLAMLNCISLAANVSPNDGVWRIADDVIVSDWHDAVIGVMWQWTRTWRCRDNVVVQRLGRWRHFRVSSCRLLATVSAAGVSDVSWTGHVRGS